MADDGVVFVVQQYCPQQKQDVFINKFKICIKKLLSPIKNVSETKKS